MRLDWIGLDATLDAYLIIGRFYVDFEGGITLFDWRLRKRLPNEGLTIYLGPFWLSVYWDFRAENETAEALFGRVAKVAERIDIDPEEIEQDIKDAIKAPRGYIPGEGIPFSETIERLRREGRLGEMGEITDKEKAIGLRERARDLLKRADALDPPYPCHTCLVGWYSFSEGKGRESCHDTCKKYADWWEKQCGIVLPLGDSVPFEQT